MIRNLVIPLFFGIMLISCSKKPETIIPAWIPYDQSEEIVANEDHPSRNMRYRQIQSKLNDKNDIWAIIQPQIQDFSAEDYTSLTPYILEKDIPAIQSAVEAGNLTYEKLVQWYLYRIALYENDSNKTLHTVITINPEARDQARRLDKARKQGHHPIYGMPILVKDNINTQYMPTTAGAAILQNNETGEDAFIISRIREKGGIILGKLSLSEWANFICNGCPNGWSAVGGQTLNPYGPRKFDTGGSSSGSGASMAANYAAAAIGTETSGSILSPASANSTVGLKPTVGLLSRMGIVPISSTLDTPGPITRNVTDNAILFSAMVGEDPEDPWAKEAPEGVNYLDYSGFDLSSLTFGAITNFLQDSLFRMNVEWLREMGANVVEVEMPQLQLNGFLTLLEGDMKRDLPVYMENYAADQMNFRTVSEVVAFNKEDTSLRIPYNQGRFEAIVEEMITDDQLDSLRTAVMEEGRSYFEEPATSYGIDVFLSMNNWSAGYAAVAHYPCLTVPMGYTKDGQPMGITFIAPSLQEDLLLKVGYAFEQGTGKRKIPEGYE